MLKATTVLGTNQENHYLERPVDLLKNWTNLSNLMKKFDRFPK